MLNFNNWMKAKETLTEASFTFGKHNGMPINKVPLNYLMWALQNVNNPRQMTPDLKREIESYLKWSLQNNNSLTPKVKADIQQHFGGGAVQPAVQAQGPEVAPPSTQAPVARMWVKAKTIADTSNIKAGVEVAMSKRPDGNWDLLSTDFSDLRNIIPGDQVAKFVQSVKDANGKPIISDDPENFMTRQAKEEPAQKQQSHILGDDQMSDEQAKIDADFEKMKNSDAQSHMMISALAGTGKAQPLTSNIFTENGWKLMGDIVVGDRVFGSNGKCFNVTGVFPQGLKSVYKITFSDDSSVECCEDHLWFTETKQNRDLSSYHKDPHFTRGSVVNTRNIISTLLYKDYPNHYIPIVKSLEIERKEVPFDSYLMGVLLGDGSFKTGTCYTTADAEILCSVNSIVESYGLKSVSKGKSSKYDYSISSRANLGRSNFLTDEIRKLGLYKLYSYEKFVPDVFKYNSEEVRLSVLQGLLDTDGSVDEHHIEYTTTSIRLRDDVVFLVQSLGGIARVVERKTKYTYKGVKKEGRLSYRIYIKLPNHILPFRLTRKLNNYTPAKKYGIKRSITLVEYIGVKECQCISVDAPDNLYLTDNLVLTHNTTTLKHLAWKYGKPGEKWLYLVFNTKNKVEAKDKFPPWVTVATTNGFLGEVLQSTPNKTKIKQTERIVNLSKYHDDDAGSKGVEKSRVIADSDAFGQILTKAGLPGTDASIAGMGKEGKTVQSLLNSMRYEFKEAVLQLAGLAKSFAHDPRDANEIKDNLNKIINDYEIDTNLSDVKDRINKYDGSYGTMIRARLNNVLKYDFMGKNFKDEIEDAVVWMLHESMPHASNIKYNREGVDYNMGQFRDFNDDLWFAATHADQLQWPKYDVVMADEVQDFNKAQQMMMKKLHDAGAKIIAVGDKNQSIYRFRGSDSKSFDNIGKMLGDLSGGGNWKPHTLSKNYRSRKAILDFTNKATHVKDLKQGKISADGNDGEVTDKDMHYNDAFNTLKAEKAKTGKVKETAFISRTNEPLIHAALKLLGDRIPFVIVGKDISRDLLKHIDKIVRTNGLNDRSPIESLKTKLEDHHEKEKDFHGTKSTKKAYLQELGDTTKALTSSIDQFLGGNGDSTGQHEGILKLAGLIDESYYDKFGNYVGRNRGYNDRDDEQGGESGKSVGDFKAWLKANLGGLEVAENERDLAKYKAKMKAENPVVLTTSHKSKGLEFGRVYILRDDQFPHPKAKNPADLEQEQNSRYVALTRAQDELHILDLEGQPGYKSNKK